MTFNQLSYTAGNYKKRKILVTFLEVTSKELDGNLLNVYLVSILKALATGFPPRSRIELVHLNLGNAQGGQILYKGALNTLG